MLPLTKVTEILAPLRSVNSSAVNVKAVDWDPPWYRNTISANLVLGVIFTGVVSNQAKFKTPLPAEAITLPDIKLSTLT